MIRRTRKRTIERVTTSPPLDRPRVLLRGRDHGRVEAHGDDAEQRAARAGHLDALRGPADQAVGLQVVQRLDFGRIGGDKVHTEGLGQGPVIEAALAHQRHDDAPAPLVLGGEPEPALDREPARIEGGAPLVDRLGVLAVDVGRGRNGRDAEAVERGPAAGAVALEIAVQRALAQGERELVVGTVLGGIWADQSWGRFWGWDPKENGALIIVLWNSLILHARWGGLVRQRGLMALAIFGNVVTAWSWFGVNMLGVGLHSYGFMDSAFWWLAAFMGSQLLAILLVALPQAWWRSTPQPAV